jgi:nitrogen fixation/metabolism regulation signal transduction histidine kinase
LISEGVTQGSTIRENIDQDILFLQNDVVGSMRINGRPYIFASFPLSDFSGKKIADLLIGISVADIETVIDNLSRTFVLLAACGIILAVFLGWSVTSRAIAQINDLSDGFSAVSSGDFTAKISLNRNDEFGDLAMAFNEMVTELKDRQEQIVETERLAILTQMAQKIVPRLTMPTESIGRGIAEIRKFAAAEYQTQSTVIEKLCQAIATETNILAKIAGEFAEFARFPAANMVDQKLDSLMDELSVFYDKEIQSGNLAIQVVDRGLMVAIDKELIRRALNIVLENAFEAAGPSGRVELRVSDARGYAAIEIVDSGPGFSDLAKKNLFAPFFTTKMDGSGLSLIMAKRIMAEHDGAIEIEDNLGGGTMVRLRLKITGKA